MSFRVLKLLALALAVAIALTGCNLVTVDETMDDATVIAKFNGGTVTKGEMKLDYEYYVSLYSSIGYTGEEAEAYVREYVTSAKVQNKILLNKAAELKLDALSAEEETKVTEDSDTMYQEYVDQNWDSFAEAGLTDEEIRKDIDAYLDSLGLGYEDVRKANRDAIVVDHLKKSITDAVTVTESEIKAKYDAMVTEDETAYASLSAFEADVTAGDATVAWYPEGYRTVKQILLSFTDEQKAELTELDTQIKNKQTELDELNALNDAAEKAETETQTGTQTGTEPNPQPADLQNEIDELNAEKQKKLDRFTASLQPKLDEINARIAAGEDFDALMAEYGEDNGMKAEPGMTQGYYVSADSVSWVAAFTEAAMALEKVGDVSVPAVSNFGVHIIRYESDVTPGAAPFDALYDDAKETVLQEKQTEAYQAAQSEWIEAANVQFDFSKF